MIALLRTVDDASDSGEPPPNDRKLNLVVPFFNERENLQKLLDEINGLAERLSARSLSLEVIFVDDGSRDGGSRVVQNWASSHAAYFDILLLRLSRNFGKESALTAGINAADGDALVMMDADLQHPISAVERMVMCWQNEGYDVVYAYTERPVEGRGLKRFARIGFYWLIGAAFDSGIDPRAGDFRLMSRRSYLALRRFSERERLMKGLYGLIGFPTKGLPYVPVARPAGRTKFSSFKLWGLALNGVTSFSVMPLRLTTIMGVLLGLIAAGYGLWTAFEKLVFGIQVPGYPTLVILISGIGAAQLIGMGIVGEYIGKVLSEAKQRPLFILESEDRIPAAQAPHSSVQDFSWTA